MAKLLKYDGADVVAKYAENDTKGRKISTKIDDLDQKIADLKAVGRFLSVWDCTEGKPMSNPPGTAPYDYLYQTGDYYIIGKTGTNNYKPSGTKYTGAVSTTVESSAVYANDFYRYAGNGDWQLVSSTQRVITFAMIDGEVNTNAKLKSALDAKQDKITSLAKLSPSLIATDSSNRFVSDSEKTTWSGKQSAITNDNKLSASLIATSDNLQFVSLSQKNNWNSKQDAFSSTTKLDPSYINWSSNYRAVTDTDKSNWNGKQSALSTAQLNAVNSGITASKVSIYDGYADAISSKQDTLIGSGTGQNIKTIDGASILGNGNVEFKTINSQSIVGSGNITVATDISGKVSKTGDSMTGELRFNVGTDNTKGITFSNSSAGSVLSYIKFNDKNDFLDIDADSGLRISTNDYWATLNTDLLTATRTYQFPNKDGTFAMASDIPDVSDVVRASSSGEIEVDGIKTEDDNFNLTFGDKDSSTEYGILLNSRNSKSSTGQRYTYIKTSSTATASGSAPVVTLPNKTGTVALTSDIKITAEDYTIG